LLIPSCSHVISSGHCNKCIGAVAGALCPCYVSLTPFLIVFLIKVTRKYWLPVDRLGLKGPRGLPIIGNVVDLAKGTMGAHFPDYLLNLIKEHATDGSKTVSLALPGTILRLFSPPLNLVDG